MSLPSDPVVDRAGPNQDERGFVAVWMAFVLTVLIGFTAFAVDLVHAYAEQARVQRAADAAALAGVTVIPDDPACIASPQQRARDLAASNKFTAANATITPTCSGPNEMTVDIRYSFNTFFARMLGAPTLTVHKKAVAQYDPPVRMGSGANFLYNVPICPGKTSAVPTDVSCLTPGISASFASQGLWANIAGTTTQKSDGNAITSSICDQTQTVPSPSTPIGVDGCTLGAPNSGTGRNDGSEFNSSGQESFTIHNDSASEGSDIYVYDAGYVMTFPDCTLGSDHLNNPLGNVPAPDNVETVWAGTPVAGSGGPTVGATFGPNAYCTGDTPHGVNDAPFPTTYELLDPVTKNPIPGCKLGPIAGYSRTNMAPALSPAQAAFNDATTRPYFHQWAKLPCSTPAGIQDYTLRVTTGAGLGQNNFSLLAIHPSLGATKNLNVFGSEKLPLAAMVPPPGIPAGGSANFFMARILPSKRQRVLTLSFFDLGDNYYAGSHVPPLPSTGQLTIGTSPDVVASSAPAGHTVGNPLFGTYLNSSSACQWTKPPDTNNQTSGYLPTPRGFINATTGCTFSFDSTRNPATPAPPTPYWDGRWVVVKLVIPAENDPSGNGYTCDTGSLSTPQQCWLMLNLRPTAGSTLSLSDVTTWEASLDGAPVRLVG